MNSNMPDNTVLTVENLSISFGGLKAVDALSFDIKEKEIFGLIGPNGAGKTTVFNCITQFYKPDTGIIMFKDHQEQVISLTKVSVHEIINHGLVRTFQNVELIRELSVLENVLIGGHVDFKCGMFSELFALPRVKKEEQKYIAQAMEILKFLKIDHYAHLIAGAQPYGIQKKVELARTLMANPRLIILDEPAAGLNDKETEDLASMIFEIRDRYHCSILLVEHDMRLVMSICDRICAISFGKMLAIGTGQEIQNNPRVQEAYLGAKD